MNFTRTLRVRPGQKVRLNRIDPGATHGFDKDLAAERSAAKIGRAHV